MSHQEQCRYIMSIIRVVATIWQCFRLCFVEKVMAKIFKAYNLHTCTCDCVESDDILSLVSGLLFGTDGGNLLFG